MASAALVLLLQQQLSRHVMVVPVPVVAAVLSRCEHHPLQLQVRSSAHKSEPAAAPAAAPATAVHCRHRRRRLRLRRLRRLRGFIRVCGVCWCARVCACVEGGVQCRSIQSAVLGIAITRMSSEKSAQRMQMLMSAEMGPESMNCRILTLGFFLRFLASLLANLEPVASSKGHAALRQGGRTPRRRAWERARRRYPASQQRAPPSPRATASTSAAAIERGGAHLRAKWSSPGHLHYRPSCASSAP